MLSQVCWSDYATMASQCCGRRVNDVVLGLTAEVAPREGGVCEAELRANAKTLAEKVTWQKWIQQAEITFLRVFPTEGSSELKNMVEKHSIRIVRHIVLMCFRNRAKHSRGTL